MPTNPNIDRQAQIRTNVIDFRHFRGNFSLTLTHESIK